MEIYKVRFVNSWEYDDEFFEVKSINHKRAAEEFAQETYDEFGETFDYPCTIEVMSPEGKIKQFTIIAEYEPVFYAEER